MSRAAFDAVEFVGGPFDGLLQFTGRSVRELEVMMAFPVNQNIMQSLDGRIAVAKLPATSVAIYQLRIRGHRPCYEFLESVAPSKFKLAHWIG